MSLQRCFDCGCRCSSVSLRCPHCAKLPKNERAKRRVTYQGRSYAVRSGFTAIPDLDRMPRLDALHWLLQHTYRQGVRAQRPNPLAGYPGALEVRG